jgi:CheY-like chemotaxis protein
MLTDAITVVLIDDDDGHVSLIERHLRRAGLANPIVRLRDGQAGLEYVQAKAAADPDSLLVLLDVKMPRLDGIEVLRRLRADAATERLMVIMLTTTDDPREIERCYELGCNVYVTKPVECEAFFEAVRRLGLFLQVVNLPRDPASP